MAQTTNENLSQRTAQRLREKISKQAKGYQQGEKLPNENVLSEELGVSRTTLREAIRILVNEGLLIVYRGRGTYVSEVLDQYAQGAEIPIGDVRELKVTLRDLFEARMIIEPQAAALAAKRASDEEIAEILHLGEVVQKNIKKDPRGQARVESENAFHGAILRAAHNDFLAQFIPVLTQTIEQTFALRENLEEIAEDAYKDHVLIMDCLKQRDEAALRSAVLIHLHHAAWHENLSMT